MRIFAQMTEKGGSYFNGGSHKPRNAITDCAAWTARDRRLLEQGQAGGGLAEQATILAGSSVKPGWAALSTIYPA